MNADSETPMGKTRQRLRIAAPALILAVALIAGAPAQAASTAPAYPNPRYPNHKPVRGDYPGSYTSSASAHAQRTGSDFDWLAAGVGATGMLGLILVCAAGRSAARIARNRRHGIPFVVDVRDDPPTTG